MKNKELIVDNGELTMKNKVVQLKDVVKIIGGGTPKKSNKDYYKGNIPWASVRDLNNYHLFDTQYKISEKAVENSSTNIIPKGNIIIVTRVGLGKVVYNEIDTAINQDLKGLILTDIIERNYLFYYFLWNAKYIEESGSGATVKGVKLNFIKELKIPLPPLPEQRRVVSKLDGLFAEIDASLALIDQNIEQAEALKLSVLDEEFSMDNEKLKIENEELKNIVKIVGGGTPKKSIKRYYKGNIPWASVRDLNVTKLNKTEYSITKEAIENSSTNVIPKGNIIIATRVGLGKVVYNEIDVAINQDLKGVILSERINRGFLFYFFKSIENYIINSGTGATVKGVKLNFIKSLIVPLPSLKVQQKIVQKLDALFEEIDGLVSDYKQKRANLEALKSSLLDQAFKGEL